MAFKLIEGTFHVVGYSPDGDSVRFMPNKPETLGLLGGSKSKINSQGHVQLRLEAIDTLETHFQGLHQPLDLAEAAMNKLMGLLEIDSIKWNEADTKVVAANDQTRGFIIAREVEKSNILQRALFRHTQFTNENFNTSPLRWHGRVVARCNQHRLQRGIAPIND